MLVTALGIVISGFSVSNVANELISFFAEYESENGKEADKKTDSSEEYPEGSAAEADLLYHMALTFYSFSVLAAIGIGGFIFMVTNNPFDDTLLVCDFLTPSEANAAYSQASSLLSQITSYETCMGVIDQLFAIEDQDKNGIITKCEDANFQHAMGSSEPYAQKFAGQYTLGAARAICKENFPNH